MDWAGDGGYFFPLLNHEAILLNSSRDPWVSALTVKPCSKSTIHRKVATRKARVQRTLGRMCMLEFRLLYEEKAGIVQHGVS